MMTEKKTLILVGCTASKSKESGFVQAENRYIGKGRWFIDDLRELFKLTSDDNVDWHIITNFPSGRILGCDQTGYFILHPQNDRIHDYNKIGKKFDRMWQERFETFLSKGSWHKIVFLTSKSSWDPRTCKAIRESHEVCHAIPKAAKGDYSPVGTWVREKLRQVRNMRPEEQSHFWENVEDQYSTWAEIRQ